MLDFLKKKSSMDRLRETALELTEGRHYVIIVPEDTDPDQLLETGFFDNFNVLIIQADRITVLEIE